MGHCRLVLALAGSSLAVPKTGGPTITLADRSGRRRVIAP